MIGSCQEESWIPDQVRDDDNLKSALKCQFPQIRDGRKKDGATRMEWPRQSG
jgi:hypothetical protein